MPWLAQDWGNMLVPDWARGRQSWVEASSALGILPGWWSNQAVSEVHGPCPHAWVAWTQPCVSQHRHDCMHCNIVWHLRLNSKDIPTKLCFVKCMVLHREAEIYRKVSKVKRAAELHLVLLLCLCHHRWALQLCAVNSWCSLIFPPTLLWEHKQYIKWKSFKGKMSYRISTRICGAISSTASI